MMAKVLPLKTRWTQGVLLGAGALALALVGLVGILLPSSEAAPQPPSKRVYFRIATGVVSGTYFPVGEAMARALSRPDGEPACDPGQRCGVKGVTAVATASEGSVANVQLVSTGHVESALTQADVALWAYGGTGPFERTGAMKGLRAVATLYPEAIHLVAAKSAHIRKVGDLRGKRVGIDSYLGGANTNARTILRAYGVPLERVKLEEVGSEVAAAKLAAGELDAFFFISGWPVALIRDLAARVPLTFVPLTGAGAEKVMEENPLLFPVNVPEGLYGDSPAIDTLGVNAVWVTLESTPNDLVYSLTRALWSDANRPTLSRAHPAGALLDIRFAASTSIPLHPGALKFYRERGIIQPVTGTSAIGPPPMPRKPPAMPPSPEASK